MNRGDRGAVVPHPPKAAMAGERVDAQMVAIMRCLLAFLALGVVYLDQNQTQSLAAVYGVLCAYAGFAIALFFPAVRRHLKSRAQPWIDVAVYIALVALTQGVGSIFYHFFFFAIVVASFSRGFREGFAVTMVAALAFAIIGLGGYAAGTPFDLTQALTRTGSLYIIGYMIAYWGGHEIALRRRLSLLRELSASVNPRGGLDTLIAQHLSQLTTFFGAQSCLLVFSKAGDANRLIYRADAARPFAVLPPDKISNDLAWPLLDLPPALCVSFDARRAWWLAGRAPRLLAWEIGSTRREHAVRKQAEELANLLEAPTFATVPYKQTDGIAGRLYLIGGSRAFNQADIQFLAQVATQMATAVNNVMLLNELTIDAAQKERSKISRDIHDTTVQSYIGLKLGLEALYRDMGEATPAAHRIKELLDMATLTVDDLRGYVDRLRGRQSQPADAQLLTQIEEQKRRYRDYHGIAVELRSASALQMNQQMAGEAYRVVCEALSNVFRHTASKQAFVDLRCEEGALAIEVGNDSPPDFSTPPFMPRSIAERAMSLGGRVQVRLNNDGHDIVRVTMPLGVENRV
jgi:signal transduction histidine kinase